MANNLSLDLANSRSSWVQGWSVVDWIRLGSVSIRARKVAAHRREIKILKIIILERNCHRRAEEWNKCDIWVCKRKISDNIWTWMTHRGRDIQELQVTRKVQWSSLASQVTLSNKTDTRSKEKPYLISWELWSYKKQPSANGRIIEMIAITSLCLQSWKLTQSSRYLRLGKTPLSPQWLSSRCRCDQEKTKKAHHERKINS